MLPRIRADLETHPVEGELVVLSPEGQVHRLDRVATVLWPLLDGSATISELAVDVSAVFGVERHEARAQLDALVQRLDDAGLLMRSQPVRATYRARDPLGFLTDPPSP